MRLWHLLTAILVVALVLVLMRDPVGRVSMVVFVMGLGETALGTAALLILFQTIAAIGHANRPGQYFEAVTATIAVLAIASLVMNGLFWLGLHLIQVSVE